MSDNIVYSTEKGDLRKDADKKKNKEKKQNKPAPVKRDGIVRVQRESKGRGGKTVSVITGLPLSGNDLEDFASKMKRKLGTGGSVSGREIIIQGDRVDSIVKHLTDLGYTAKRAGG